MKMIDSLRQPPERITDISLLANALYTLKELGKEHKQPYVFEYIQQPMIGGTIHPVPADRIQRGNATRVIARYSEADFERRISELQYDDCASQ